MSNDKFGGRSAGWVTGALRHKTRHLIRYAGQQVECAIKDT